MSTSPWPEGDPPPWPIGESPPWSEDHRPPLSKLVRAYPGRAIANALLVLLFHAWLTGSVVLWALTHLLGTFAPRQLLQLPLILAWAIPVYLLVAAAWWVHESDGQNRDWWQWNQEGD